LSKTEINYIGSGMIMQCIGGNVFGLNRNGILRAQYCSRNQCTGIKTGSWQYFFLQ